MFSHRLFGLTVEKEAIGCLATAFLKEKIKIIFFKVFI